MKPLRPAPMLLLTGLLTALLLVSACIPSSLSCNSSDAGPTPRPEGPVRADFYASKTELQGKGGIRFFHDATGPVKEWSWDFNGDGNTDVTGPEAVWRYLENGYYDVTLTVEGWDGSQDSITKTDYIYVWGCST